MWRSARRLALRNKILQTTLFQRLYSTEKTEDQLRRSGGGKVIFGFIAAAGIGSAGVIVYGKYDPKFKAILEDNVPFLKIIYKWLGDWENKPVVPPKDLPISRKSSESDPVKSILTSDVLKQKQDNFDRMLSKKQKPSEPVTKPPEPVATKDAISISDKSPIIKVQADIEIDHEKVLQETFEKLKKASDKTLSAHKAAVEAIQNHTKQLYDALDFPEGVNGEQAWKDVNDANNRKSSNMKLASQTASNTKDILEKLRSELKKVPRKDSQSGIVKSSEAVIAETQEKLQNAESELVAAEFEARTASEYRDLVNASKEKFRKELQVILPKYVYGDKDKTVTEDELNLLIAHAHRRIEQLQKQLARQKVTENLRVRQAVDQQKLQDGRLIDEKVLEEMEKRQIDFEKTMQRRISSMKEEFEIELRQQLRRQAAAHSDHLNEVMKIQEKEMERKHVLELEEKLLHQKGVFISELSGSMSHLKGIADYMQARNEFDKSSKKAQALWLACQAVDVKISTGMFDDPCPLGKEVASIKTASEGESEFVDSVIAGIPTQAVDRGVFTRETLKHRFCNVKKVCRRVAIIDENNNSLYKYFLSYLQSLLVVDTISIPKEELEGKVAVNPSEWDTFDILNRVSYCLQTDNMEQALRYANQLRGEPRVVAKDWINEVRLFLETKLAVNALLAHAAAISVQAYH